MKYRKNDRVILLTDYNSDQVTIPKGSVGTIVDLYTLSESYDVNFRGTIVEVAESRLVPA